MKARLRCLHLWPDIASLRWWVVHGEKGVWQRWLCSWWWWRCTPRRPLVAQLHGIGQAFATFARTKSSSLLRRPADDCRSRACGSPVMLSFGSFQHPRFDGILAGTTVRKATLFRIKRASHLPPPGPNTATCATCNCYAGHGAGQEALDGRGAAPAFGKMAEKCLDLPW